jgi:hypothetical protein
VSVSGKHINVKLGATPAALVGVQSWTAEDSVQELDATTAADGGYARPDVGIQSVTVSMQLVIDIAAGSLTPVQAGSTLTDLALYATTTATSPIYSIPSALVLKSTPKGEISGRFSLDLVVKNIGSYTLANPSG